MIASDEDESLRSIGRRAATKLVLWAVYESPSDYPGKYVARSWIGAVPSAYCLVADSLAELESQLPPGLVFLPRDPSDDPCILGTWL